MIDDEVIDISDPNNKDDSSALFMVIIRL